MPRRAKGPRLYLDPKRKEFVIRDGSYFQRTGCGEGDGVAAEKYLADYIGHKHRPEKADAPLIADVLNVYASEVAIYRKTAKNLGYVIGHVLTYWGAKTVADITKKSCEAYAKTRTRASASRGLKTLRAAVRYWHESEDYGPLAMLPRFQLPPEGPPRERWLTREEAARLLRAARPYQHIRRCILLGLYTGSRPGVLLDLEWRQIDLRGGVMRRTKPGATEDARKRAPTVRLGYRIAAHLRRWYRLDRPEPTDRVCYFEGTWHPGRRIVINPQFSWRQITGAADLRGVTLHTLRHTRATWMAQAGVTLFEAAGFLGMTARTLEKVYAHHSPDFQDRAANLARPNGHVSVHVSVPTHKKAR